MQIPPTYTITNEMIDVLTRIDALRLFISSYTIPPQVKERIQRTSVLKSSLFSARIEGNPLQMDEIITTDKDDKKLEVFNILKTIQSIDKMKKSNNGITLEIIKWVHSNVMNNLRQDAGKFRTEVNAIFNQAGIAVYLPPPPMQLLPLLKQLISYCNITQEKSPLIKAFITHLVFEKIHPFIDGNGRVGRLLIYLTLKLSKYDFGIAIPFEEYLDTHKDDYYFYLDSGMQDTNSYLLFMLEAFLNQCQSTQKMILEELQKKEVLDVPPRQEELYRIIKEHQVVSFDFLRRRFLKIPERTLRYDLKKLQDKNYILKIGKTRGAYYRTK